MTVTLNRPTVTVPAPRTEQDPQAPIWHLPEEVIALALAASNMPALTPLAQPDPVTGASYSARGLECSITAWTWQGIERIGGMLTAHLLAYRSRDLTHALAKGHANEAERSAYAALWGTEDRHEQAGSLSCDVFDQAGREITSPLPDELDSFHQALMDTALDSITITDVTATLARRGARGCARCL